MPTTHKALRDPRSIEQAIAELKATMLNLGMNNPRRGDIALQIVRLEDHREDQIRRAEGASS